MSIYEYCTGFYILEMPILAFHLPHIRIIETCYCSIKRREEFKPHESLQDVFCSRDYSEQVVASFEHQI